MLSLEKHYIVATTRQLIALLWLAAFTLHSYASPQQPLVIGGLNLYIGPPYSWVDSCSGKLLGSSQHLIEKAFSELNYTTRIVPATATTNQINDNYFALFGSHQTLVNAGYSSLSDAIIRLESGILYRKNSPYTIKTIDDMKQLRGSISKAGRQALSEEKINPIKQFKLELRTTETLNKAITLLQTEQTDYVLIGQYYARLIAMQQGTDNTLAFQRIDAINLHTYLGMQPESDWQQLLPAFNQALKKLLQQPGYTEHLNKRYLLSKLNNSDC